MDTHRDGYDILSLLAATIESFPDNPSLEEEMLSHICVEETSFWKEDPLGAGRSCTVVETPPGLLVKNIDSKCRRPTVAKMILLRRNKYILRSPKNESSMRSMATELFVLRNRYLAKHPHVVDLLGVSWGVSNGPDEQVMPVFVLERAELGDLASFTRQTPAMSLAEQLVLGMHVALGLQAVHDVGVIHGDIKPENILVFLGCDNRPIAKLADFGSAVLLSEERSTSHRPTGTPLWQSPWSARPQTKHLLLRSDIYSLALVLSILITGLDYETLGTLEPETLHELKTLDKLADFLFQRILAAENDFPSGETTTTLNLKRFLFALTLSPNPDQDVTQALVKGMGVLKILKALLHLVVSKRARKDPDYVCSLGPLERDAYLKPTMEPESEIDTVVRVALEEAALEDSDSGDETNEEDDDSHADETRTPPLDSQAAAEAPSSLDTNEPCPTPADAQGANPSAQGDYGGELGAFASEAELGYPKSPGEPVVRAQPHDAVISHRLSFKKLRNLPTRICSLVLRELERVAHSTSQPTVRRAAAAYEFAAFAIACHQFGPPFQRDLMRKAAELLIQAAQMGHPLARASFRTVLAALGHPSDDISQDTESGWLSDLVKTGEGQQSLAKRRLCQLDPTKYVPAIQERWRLYCEGTPSYAAMMDRFKDIFSATSESDLILSFAWEKIEPGTADFLMFAHFNLLRKHWSILKQVLPSLGADINAAVFQDRTLLMEACYAGDAKAAIILIDAGADVTSAAQSDGVTPLHLLSKFPDDKISNVAAKLKDAGADIEARCHLPRQPPGRTDLLDATVRATPLLSAVVAQSIPAVRALLCLGADPFDEAAMVPEGYAPAPFREGDRCYGPVHYAARLHLFDILQELLPEDQRYEQLNTSVRYEEPSLEVRPIWCALDYSNIGLWERLCLHGDGHIMRCKQTVLFLYKRGARNSKTFVHLQDQYHRRSFAASCHCGQPFLMQLLWNIPDGQLRPESIDLARIFQTAIDFDDLPVVEHLYPLLEQSVLKTAGTEQFTFKASVQGYKPAAVIDYMIKLQQRLAANPDGRIQIQLIRDRKETVIIGEDAGPVAVPRYQGGIRVSLSIRPGLAGLADWSVGSVTSARPDGDLLPPPAPGPPTLESTILGGYFDLARELYEPGKSDLICRRADGVGSSTLLGRLIKESKKSPAAERQVHFVLSLDPSASDDLFWNVVEDDDGGLQYTALHLAVTLPDESWGIRQPRVALPVLMSILRKWASAEHLNQLTSTGPDGVAALHIAVETGNLEGLELLANEVSEGLDWDIQNGLGETPLDLALWRAHNAAQIVRESGIVSREDPRWSSKTREVCETSLKMKDLLREEGAHHRKIGGMVIREGNDNWTIKKLCDLPTPMLSQVEEDMRFCKDNGLFGNEERGAGEAPQGEEEQLRFQAAMEELRKRSPFWLEMPVGGIVLLPTTVPETA